ncbi:MAG: cytochrome c5 family protein [Burkholderiales bacterium]
MSAPEEHSSFIKTPQQLIVVVLLAFLVPIIGIVLIVNLVLSRPGADPAALAPEAVAERIQPVGSVAFAGAAPGAATSGAKSGEEVYNSVCAACHGTGVAGAPKVGDNAAWAKPVQQGFDTLLKHAIDGIRAMPPRGGNPGLSDLEMARAVAHMANRSGGKFKEPAAPAAGK